VVPPVMGGYGIVTRRDRPLSAGVAAFADSLRAVLRESRDREAAASRS
jgi:hypothetical protein